MPGRNGTIGMAAFSSKVTITAAKSTLASLTEILLVVNSVFFKLIAEVTDGNNKVRLNSQVRLRLSFFITAESDKETFFLKKNLLGNARCA
jgi:hypothetical protein